MIPVHSHLKKKTERTDKTIPPIGAVVTGGLLPARYAFHFSCSAQNRPEQTEVNVGRL